MREGSTGMTGRLEMGTSMYYLIVCAMRRIWKVGSHDMGAVLSGCYFEWQEEIS